MYHIVFIHSSVDGHLGCFHVLAILNSAAMNIGVHVSFQITVFVLFKKVISKCSGEAEGTPAPKKTSSAMEWKGLTRVYSIF